MPSSAVVTGAAPVWVGERLSHSQHRGQVVHAGSDAIYFRSADDIIGVVSRHAVPVPCTITTLLDTVDDLFRGAPRPRAGDLVEIGSGVVDFGQVRVRVGRYVDFTLRPFDRRHVPQMREHLAPLAPALSPGEIDPPTVAALREEPAEQLEQVLGRGSGLTPFGDDVVCGMLATLLACGAPCADTLRTRTLELAPTRTTSLSATLLARAAQGDVLPAFAHVVSALLDGPETVTSRVGDLLRVGHTSGAGMLLGLSLALDHIHTRSCCS